MQPGAHLAPSSARYFMQIVERGCALLGYVPIGNIGMLLLATRLRTAAMLPGGHAVRLVTESRWLQLPLQVCSNYHNTSWLFVQSHLMSCNTKSAKSYKCRPFQSWACSGSQNLRWWLSYIHLSFSA